MPINLLSPFSKKQAGTAEESLLGTKVDIKTYDDKPLGVVVRHSIEEYKAILDRRFYPLPESKWGKLSTGLYGRVISSPAPENYFLFECFYHRCDSQYKDYLIKGRAYYYGFRPRSTNYASRIFCMLFVGSLCLILASLAIVLDIHKAGYTNFILSAIFLISCILLSSIWFHERERRFDERAVGDVYQCIMLSALEFPNIDDPSVGKIFETHENMSKKYCCCC